jgi:hypothetical protein
MDAELLAHEGIQERGGGVVSGDGLLGGGIELGRGVIEAKSAEHLGEGEGLKIIGQARGPWEAWD